jgi:hypothetical protein
MREQTQVEWKELREHGEDYVLFRVVATETPEGWRLSEQDSWDFRSYEVNLSPENVFIAEYAKRAMAKGSMTFDRILRLVRVENRGVSRYEISGEHEVPEASLRAKNRTLLTRIMFLRRRFPVSISGDQAPPSLAA